MNYKVCIRQINIKIHYTNTLVKKLPNNINNFDDFNWNKDDIIYQSYKPNIYKKCTKSWILFLFSQIIGIFLIIKT